MIKPQERFLSEGQSYFGPSENPKTITHCNVWDCDQLRMIKIKGTAKLFPPEEDRECPILAQFADYLSPEVRAVTVDDAGLLSGISTDPLEDDTFFVPYLPFSTVQSLADCRTIQYSNLQELDWLGPGVDLSLYDDESGNPQKDELNVLKNLPPHPNLVPLDRVVLEDAESRVIGFTTKYIPKGCLDNPRVPFRFELLQQLTQLVDFLNLELGIMHQDIAPRNLLIDPDTKKLLLFDFDWVACGKKGLLDGRDDVSGVVFTLYELITNNTHFTSIPHWERNLDTVQNISGWTGNRELDSEVSIFCDFQNEWIASRNSDGDMDRYLNAPSRLTWLDLPTAPDYLVPFEHGKTLNGETVWITGPRLRRTAIEMGQYCFRWERPPQSRLLLETAENGV